MIDPTLTRRRLIQLFGVAGAGALAAACAGPGSSSRPTGTVEAGPIEGDLSFAHWRAEDKAVFDQLIADFTKANPKATIRQDISPSNDYQSTALQKIKGGTVGDVFVAFRGAQFVSMAQAGLYADVSGQSFVSNFKPELISAGKADGKQLGFPYQLVFNMPVTNQDALQKAGITARPPDWDSFLAMCETLKSKGLIPMAWPGGEAGNAGQLFNCMVMNNAPSDDMCTKLETGEYKVTDSWFVDTLKQYAQLRPYFQPNATGTAVEPAQQLFASGQAAMLATGNFHIAAVRKLGAQFPMDMLAPITVSKDKAKYEGIYNATFILGVNTASKKQPAAAGFVAFLADPKNAGVYGNGTGQHVTVKNVDYTNADLKALAPWLDRKTLLAPRFQFNNLDIRAAIEGAAVKVVGGASPEQAADEAEKIVAQRRK